MGIIIQGLIHARFPHPSCGVPPEKQCRNAFGETGCR